MARRKPDGNLPLLKKEVPKMPDGYYSGDKPNPTTAYTVYSQVFECPRCLEKVPLFDCVEMIVERAKGKGERAKRG